VASIDDSSGVPIISKFEFVIIVTRNVIAGFLNISLGVHEPPTADELGDGLTKKQIIMSLDMALWKVRRYPA
jgi:hypothetical protein